MIPEGWRAVRLGDVVDDVTVGHVGSMASQYRTNGIPFLRSQNVRPHRIDLSDVKYIGEDFHARLKKSQLLPGDVVTVRTGKPGTSAVVDSEIGNANCADLVITRPGDEIDPHWLAYYLNFVTDTHVSIMLVGAVQQHFNVGAMRALQVALPPKDVQKAIVEVLGALDDKIAANTKFASTAEDFALALYREATCGVEMVPMSSRLVPVLGGTPARSTTEFWGGENLWISARDVTGAGQSVILDTEEKITDLAIASTKAKPLPAGSVILTARGTVGAVARLAESASFNQSCYGFAPGALPASVLYFAIRAATDHAKALAHGSVFDTITMKTFDHLSVPGLDADSLDVLEGSIRGPLDIVEASQRESRTLAAARDTLLPQLMSGKLRVKDAERIVSEVA